MSSILSSGLFVSHFWSNVPEPELCRELSPTAPGPLCAPPHQPPENLANRLLPCRLASVATARGKPTAPPAAAHHPWGRSLPCVPLSRSLKRQAEQLCPLVLVVLQTQFRFCLGMSRILRLYIKPFQAQYDYQAPGFPRETTFCSNTCFPDAYGCPVFLVSSLQEIFLSPSLRFGILVENQLAVRAKVYFWTLSFVC